MHSGGVVDLIAEEADLDHGQDEEDEEEQVGDRRGVAHVEVVPPERRRRERLQVVLKRKILRPPGSYCPK